MASGYYSTASGDYNKALGNRSFVTGYLNTTAATSNYSLISGQRNSSTTECTFTGGKSNTNNGVYSLVYGNTNTLPSGSSSIVAGGQNQITAPSGKNPVYGVCLGGGNKGNLFYGMMIGTENRSGSYGGSRLIGDKLESTNADQMIIGRLNNTTTSLSAPSVIIANGYNVGATDYRQSAIEIDQTDTKILSNLQLASDTTAVNAITPAQNSPASADDMTLVTKSYVDNLVTSKSLSYQPVSEQQLNIYTSYSIATLLGQTTWEFPFSGGGSIDFVFSYGSAPGRIIWYRCHIPLPSYLNTQNTPKINVALAQISSYPVTNDSNGELQGILLEYDTAAKTIQFIGGEGVIVENGPDNFKEAYNQGDLHPWFWGLTCNSFI